MYNYYTDLFKTNHSMLCTWLPMSPYLKPCNYVFGDYIKYIVNNYHYYQLERNERISQINYNIY